MHYFESIKCPFQAFFTNINSLQCGDFSGDWVSFPLGEEKQIELFEKYATNQFVITDFQVHLYWLNIEMLNEIGNMHELNELALLISNLSNENIKKMEAIVETNKIQLDGKQFIEILKQIEFIEIDSDIDSEEDYVIQLCKQYKESYTSLLELLLPYLDMKQLCNDLLSQNNMILTTQGLLKMYK